MNYNASPGFWLHVFYVFFEVELKSNTALTTSECDVYFIDIEKSMEKHVSDHSKYIWKWRRPYMVTNGV